MYFSDNLDLSQKDGGDDNVVIRSGRVFTVPRDKILPYFKGFRQDEYPTTFPPPPPAPAIYMGKYAFISR